MQHFGFFEDWRNFSNLQKIGKFLELEVALILRYLLTDLLLIKTKLALVRPGPNTVTNGPIIHDRSKLSNIFTAEAKRHITTAPLNNCSLVSPWNEDIIFKTLKLQSLYTILTIER